MSDIKKYLMTMINLEKELALQESHEESDEYEDDVLQKAFNSNYIDTKPEPTFTGIEARATEDDNDLDLGDLDDIECEMDSDDGEEVEPLSIEEIEGNSDSDNGTEEDLLAWADTTNFIISAKRLSEFLGEVLYSPDTYIGVIEGYEEYMASGEYYITGMTSVQGMIVSLVYEDLEGNNIYVNVVLNDDGVEVHNVTEQ